MTAVEYAQKQFGSTYEEVNQSFHKTRKQARLRIWVARTLKGVALFGGIVIAAGVAPKLAQAIGIAISASVAIDFLFGNYPLMLAYAKAADAYEQLLRRARREQTIKLIPILDKVGKDDPGAAAELTKLLEALLAMMHSASEEIERALSQKNISALEQLKIEHEKEADKKL